MTPTLATATLVLMLPKRFICAGLAAIACNPAESDDELRVVELPGIPLSDDEVFALGLVDENWAGAGLGVGIGQWSALGPINWKPADQVDEDFEAAVAQAEQAPPSEPGEQPATINFLVADVQAGEAYFVAMQPEQMAALGAAMQEAESENPPSQADAWNDGVEARARSSFDLSNGPDIKAVGRSLLPLATTAQHPYRTMGAKLPPGSGETDICSGTLIGSKSVLTAAHCLVKYGQGNYQDWYTTTEYGWWIGKNGGGADACYYFTSIDKMFVPAQVVQAGQGTYWYYAYDYALVYLTQVPQQIPPQQTSIQGCPSSPGWMAKTWVSDTYIGTYDYRHSGYPDCANPEAPPACVISGHYESFWISAAHDSANTVVEDNLATVVKHDGVTSQGHSGGPLWFLRGGATPTIVGTHVGGQPDRGYTKVFRRLTPTSLNQISTWQCIAGPCI